MEPIASSQEALSLEQLVQLHALTKDIAKLFQKQLHSYLDSLAILFRSRRALGDAIEGSERESIGSSAKALVELKELFRSVAERPFDLRPELPTPIESVSTQLQLHEWEYLHQAKTDRGWRSTKVIAPLTWVVTYSSTYSLAMVRQVLAGQEQRNSDAIRAFVLRACLMHLQITKFPAMTELLEGLRYRVEIRRLPEMGDLPLVTVSAPLRTLRPPDHLVAMASALSGGSSFAEVIDLESARALKDPVREAVSALFANHQQEL